jgi:hypothetical protein
VLPKRKLSVAFVGDIRIYGPICEGVIWRLRYNEELYRLYDEIDLVTTIWITRLRWAGRVVQMQDNLWCKKITLDKPEGRRRVGRPNIRRMDGVMRDAERLGVKNWRSKAKDRDGWRRLLESAKTLHGLYCLGVSEFLGDKLYVPAPVLVCLTWRLHVSKAH